MHGGQILPGVAVIADKRLVNQLGHDGEMRQPLASLRNSGEKNIVQGMVGMGGKGTCKEKGVPPLGEDAPVGAPDPIEANSQQQKASCGATRSLRRTFCGSYCSETSK